MSHLKRKEKLALLLCALFLAAAAVALITANQLQVRQTDTQMQSNITASSGSSQASTPEDGEKNLQKDTDAAAQFAVVSLYDGHVAAFYPDEEQPFLTLGVTEDELTAADRLLLMKGIPAASRAELLHILEDFES